MTRWLWLIFALVIIVVWWQNHTTPVPPPPPEVEKTKQALLKIEKHFTEIANRQDDREIQRMIDEEVADYLNDSR